MGIFSALIGKARPQIPLEALISSRHTGLYKMCYRGFMKSGMPYMAYKVAGNTDNDTQAFIGVLSLDDEIEVVRGDETEKYTVRCGGIEFGSLNVDRICGGRHPDELDTFILKIELNTDGIYEVTIGVIWQR